LLVFVYRLVGVLDSDFCDLASVKFSEKN